MKNKKFWGILTVMILGLCLTLSACSQGSIAENQEAYSSSGSGDSGYQKLKEASDGTDSDVNVATNRKLIKTVSYTIESEQFDETVEKVQEKAEALGGYVESSSVKSTTWYSATNFRSATFTVRIPAENLKSFCETAEEIGNVLNRSETVEDVTLNYTDLSSKVKTLETKRDTLISMLAEAKTVSEMLEIQDYLSDCESELESYKSQLLVLENLVDYSTVNLTIQEVYAYTEPEPETLGQRIAQEFKESWQETVEFFEELIVGILGNIPGILTTVLILGLVALIVVSIIRKVNKKRKKAPEEKQ